MKKILLYVLPAACLFAGCGMVDQISPHSDEIISAGEMVSEAVPAVTAFNPMIGLVALGLGGLLVVAGKVLKAYAATQGDKK